MRGMTAAALAGVAAAKARPEARVRAPRPLAMNLRMVINSPCDCLLSDCLVNDGGCALFGWAYAQLLKLLTEKRLRLLGCDHLGLTTAVRGRLRQLTGEVAHQLLRD